MNECERELLRSFRIHFKSENTIGNEYFSGDITKMKDLFDIITTRIPTPTQPKSQTKPLIQSEGPYEVYDNNFTH